MTVRPTASSANGVPEVPNAAPSELHVSSLVVQVRPEHAEAATAAIRRLPGAEVPAAGDGKLVVTLETRNEAEILSIIDAIGNLRGVLSAVLVFHHVDVLTNEEVGPCPPD